ncbi:MAG: hypothetical protein PVJ33_02775 [Lysobacterales bacterium]|jgi:hypothetical protein
MKERLTERELLLRLAELPREIEPRQDPWPDIAARISGAAQKPKMPVARRTWAWRAAAASLVAAVAAGVWLAPSHENAQTGAEPAIAATEPVSRSAPVSTIAGSVAASEAEYQAAFREFIPVGDYSRESLAPQTLENIEKGWADMRSAEAALSAALEQNPNNRFLNDRMLELRARQLGFLQQLASLDLANRRMNT